jgi:hypothetical protein
MRSAWLAVLFGLALVAGPRMGSAGTPEKSDDWKGATLDTKWHLTVMGDAQDNPHSVRLDNGTLRITAGGSDIWNDNDNGLFLWQWANGDFRAVIEIRSIEQISESSTAGLMVRASTNRHAPRVYMRAMPKGTHLEARTALGEMAGPLSDEAGRLPWGDGSGNGPTMQMRLTRTGKQFKSERSFDGGKTWERLHDTDHPDADTLDVQMPDDVLIGIMVGAVNETGDTSAAAEAVLGPFQFTQSAARTTEVRPAGGTEGAAKGLLAATAVDVNGEPVADAYVLVRNDSDVVGTTKTDVGLSNTGSFFLPAGKYTVTAMGEGYNEGKPESVEIKAGQTVEIRAALGVKK